MAKFIVTHGKCGHEVGAVLEFDTVPPSMVGKVMPLPEGVALEVATPEPVRRGRPPTNKQEQE